MNIHRHVSQRRYFTRQRVQEGIILSVIIRVILALSVPVPVPRLVPPSPGRQRTARVRRLRSFCRFLCFALFGSVQGLQ